MKCAEGSSAMTEQLYRESRYAGMYFLRSADERAEIERQVDAAFVRTFGDDKSLPSEEYNDAGYAFAMHIKEHGWDTRTPQDCPAWVSRIEKARREIVEHKTECRVNELAKTITPEIRDVFLLTLRG